MMAVSINLQTTVTDSILGQSEEFSNNTIIIDNGSYNCRAGFAVQKDPYLVFKNVVCKPRFKKDSILVGNDIPDIENVRNNIKIAFDRNLVTQYEIQEIVFDHIFSKLGVSSESVDHPIFINEAVANPNLCRSQMSELLFEAYGVPKVAYYVDGLASYSYNTTSEFGQGLDDGLVLSFGYHTVHVLPVLDGTMNLANAKRINIGGAYTDWYMQRLLQLKYPCHTSRLTLSLGENLVHNYCRVAENYREEMKSWKDKDFLTANSKILQFPFVKHEESISSEQVEQRRQYQIQRLKETHYKRQMDRLRRDQEQLEKLESINELVLHGSNQYCQPKNKLEVNAAIRKALKAAGLKNVAALKEGIRHYKEIVQRLECKLDGIEYVPEKVDKPENSYHLIAIPDEDLDTDELKMKRRQMMLKGAAERREKIKALKEEQRRKMIEAVKQLEDKREDDFLSWLMSLRFRRQNLIESRTQRKNRKFAGTGDADRKLIQQHRIRLMAADLGHGVGTRRGQQTNNGDSGNGTNGSGDQLLTGTGVAAALAEAQLVEHDSEDSEAEQEQLSQLDTLMAQYDPEFSKDLGGAGLKVELDEYYRLHLTTEQMRIPEVFWEPSLIGSDQAGLRETLNWVLQAFSDSDQQRLVNRVFLTGGIAHLPGLLPRVETELRQMRPCGSKFSVVKALNPSLDAWHGARRLSQSPHFTSSCITKAEYEEKGHDYLEEHPLSSRYFPHSV